MPKVIGESLDLLRNFIFKNHEITLPKPGNKLPFLVHDGDWQSNAPDEYCLRLVDLFTGVWWRWAGLRCLLLRLNNRRNDDESKQQQPCQTTGEIKLHVI